MDPVFEEHGKKRRGELEDDQPTNRVVSLPHEIILNIWSRLPITSLIQCKFVCKSWRALAQDPYLATLHFSRASQANPCLLFHSDNPIRNHLYFADISVVNHVIDRAKRIVIPFWNSMPEFDVVGSCNGLLCLSDSLYGDAVYIYNPFTGDYMEVPRSTQPKSHYSVFGFGFHPTNKEYKLVKISGHMRVSRIGCTQSEVQVLTLGSSTWRRLERVSYQLARRYLAVLVNGKLHWPTCWRGYLAGRTRSIVSFDLAEEKFEEIPKPDCHGFNRHEYQLLVLGGCLSAAVYFNDGRMEIWVMKDYGVKESWIKEFNIGAYQPKGLKENIKRPFRIYKNAFNGRSVRIVCLLKNGEILLAYKCRALVTYDPNQGNFRELTFQGMPNWFQTVVHVGSLGWIDTPIYM